MGANDWPAWAKNAASDAADLIAGKGGFGGYTRPQAEAQMRNMAESRGLRDAKKIAELWLYSTGRITPGAWGA